MYYDEDYEPTQEKMEEIDGLGSTKVEHNNEVININFNTENFASGIVAAVVQSLKENIYKEVVDQIRKECLEDIREKIQVQTGEIIKEIIDDYMNTEKIAVGGNSVWDDEPKEELTFIQYVKRCMKNIIKNGKFKVVKSVEKNRYSDKYVIKTEDFSFDEYIKANCGIDNEVKAYLDKEVDKVRQKINKDIKDTFDETTRNMLSQSVLNILMANDTYKKIESNIASIANS